MTIYHKHHIVPRHAGGTDDPSNLIVLTVEEHAEAHRQLYEQYGRWQDRVAYEALSGQIGKDISEYYPKGEEHHWWGKKHTDETLVKMRKNKIGKKNPMYGSKWTDKQHAAVEKRAQAKRRPCIIDNVEYESRTAAAKALGVSKSTITRLLGKFQAGS